MPLDVQWDICDGQMDKITTAYTAKQKLIIYHHIKPTGYLSNASRQIGPTVCFQNVEDLVLEHSYDRKARASLRSQGHSGAQHTDLPLRAPVQSKYI